MHTVYDRVACHFRGGGVALLKGGAEFSRLVEEVMSDVDFSERSSFTESVLSNIGFCSRRRELERVFRDRVYEKSRSGELSLTCEFFGEEAALALPNYLEVHRAAHLRVSYRFEPLHDESDRIALIILHRQRSLFDRLARRYGAVHRELLVPLSEIDYLAGSARTFFFSAGERRYRFSPGGRVECADGSFTTEWGDEVWLLLSSVGPQPVRGRARLRGAPHGAVSDRAHWRQRDLNPVRLDHPPRETSPRGISYVVLPARARRSRKGRARATQAISAAPATPKATR